MMETSKKKAACAKLPIYNDMLVAISTKAILASGRFLHTTDAWEEKNDVDKTWSEWKETYLAAHKYHKNHFGAAGDAGGNDFCTANAATNPNSDHKVTFQDRPPNFPNGKLDRLDSYLTNMSDTVSNAVISGSLEAADISNMAKILETLTLANATLVKEVA